MARTKKMICHDCGTIFNRKPQNGVNQICWNCQSTSVALVTDKGAPPPNKPGGAPQPPGIPQAPSAAGLKMPAFTGKPGGGAITPEMLLKAKGQLKKVVRPPIVLPGGAVTPIPKGVRMLAHLIKNPIVSAPGMELGAIWKPRGSRDEFHAYTPVTTIDVSAPLRNIAMGIPDPDHAHANSSYMNRSLHLPTRKGPRGPLPMQGISYFEYGWKRPIHGGALWYGYQNGGRYAYSPEDNQAVQSFLRNLRQGKIFSERLVIAETGEVFYTPDHYATFYRYHPGTMAWYQYRSASGAAGPIWDESFYDEPR